MTTDVITVPPGARALDAAVLLREHGITSLPVVDDEGRVVGIVSDSDIRARSHGGHRTVREVMSDAVLCLPEHADTSEVAGVMLDNGVRAVPIVAGDRVVGIVSRRDLLRLLVRDES
jgi:CBS domain-containing protein